MPDDGDSDLRERVASLESAVKSVDYKLESIKKDQLEDIKKELETLSEKFDKLTAKVNEEMTGFQSEIIRLKLISQVLIFIGGALSTGFIALIYDFIRRSLVGA